MRRGLFPEGLAGTLVHKELIQGPGLSFILKVTNISDNNPKPPRKEFLLLTAIFQQLGKQSMAVATPTEPCGRAEWPSVPFGQL